LTDERGHRAEGQTRMPMVAEIDEVNAVEHELFNRGFRQPRQIFLFPVAFTEELEAKSMAGF